MNHFHNPQSITVLLIDDNPDDRALTIRELRRNFPDVKVEEIIDAKALSQALEAGGFDIVITDYQLHWINGLKVLNMVKSHYPDCPVIMFTGTATQEIAVDAFKSGLDDYVIKSPKHFMRLPVAVKASLEKARQRWHRKQAEEALLESERYLKFCKFAVDSMEYSKVAIVDRDYRYRFVSEWYVRMYDLSEDEILGKTVAELMGEEAFIQFVKPNIDKALNGKIAHYSAWFDLPNGKTYCDVTYYPIKGPEGIESVAVVVHDMTAHKHTEDALRESEEKYRQLFSAESDAIMIFDTETREFIDVNESALSLYGYNKEEFLNLRHPAITAEPEESEDSIKETLAGKLIRIPIRYHKKKDGTIFPVEISAGTFTLKNRKVLFGVIRDITERKRSEQQILVANERLQYLLSGTSAVIYTAKTSGAYGASFISENVSEMVGYEPREFLEDSGFWFKHIHPEDQSQISEEVSKVFKKDFHACEYRFRHKDGTYIWVRDEMKVVRDRDGRPLETIGFWANITERKRAEDALRDSRHMLQTVLDSTPSGIFWKDRDSSYLGGNRTWLEAVGLKSSERVVGKSDYDLPWGKKQADSFREDDRRVMESGIPEYDIIEPYLQADGTHAWAKTNKVPLRDTEGNVVGVLGTYEDITERKQAEEALRRLNEEFLKAHNHRKMLSKYLIDLLEKDRRQIAMELHDHIGQTLTSLKMSLEMIHGKLKPDNTELEARITVAQERTIQAIKDVKNVSHGLRPAMIDALGVVSALRELFNEIRQQTDIEIHFFSQGIPNRFKEEKELAIYRITQEALSNIIRHARAKNVFVNLVKKDDKLSLSVEDDGVGFDQDKVMKPSGPLGLLIMRERAVQLGGEFTIESQPGKGTHLLVEIPI